MNYCHKVLSKIGKEYEIYTDLKAEEYRLYLEEPSSYLVVKDLDGIDVILPKSEIECIECQ